ncbi:MAG: rhomboid family intramembrane serine protease [Armatimonadetes bacterium]|nr:rhomboid family intramembrane serine protease [Armatimonadota bacterium]
MIPLYDANPARTRPVVIYAIVAACAAAFLYTFYGVGPEPGTAEALRRYGMIPAALTGRAPPEGVPPSLTLITSMFLHGGWVHLIGNLWYLWIFGDNVEDAMGRGRFLLFYLAGGIAGSLAHAFTHPSSTVPTIGASGAIAGVLGAYLVLFPGARIVSLVPLGWFAQVVEIQAYIYLPLWFLLQFANGILAVGLGGGSMVAWWAHIGGFAAGVVLGRVLARRRRPRP